MSFSKDTKDELANLDIGGEREAKAELAAFLRTNSTISISFRDEITVRFQTENSGGARRIYKILKNLYSYEAQIEVSKNDQLRKNSFYKVDVKDEEVARYILDDSGFNTAAFSFSSLENPDKGYKLRDQESKKAYLRASFLGAGSITNPNKSYHLEVVYNNSYSTKVLKEVLKEFDLKFGEIERKDQYIVYLKESESISNFLVLIGATNQMLKFENIRAMKNLRNNVVRMVNCENANIDKIIDASQKQLRAIDFIEKTVGLESLPLNLRELAIKRRQFPEDSIKDLASRLDGGLAKSTVNNRLKKIIRIAEEIESKY